MLEQNGFRSQINQPTRENETTSSIIDHIFVKINAKLKINCLPIVLQNNITDHYPTILNIEFNETSQQKLEKEKTVIKIDDGKLLRTVALINWNELYEEKNPNNAIKIFYENINSSLKEATNIIKIKNKNNKLKPWMTQGILNAIRKRDKLKQRVLKNKHSMELKNYYKNYRNIVTTLIKTTKNNFYKEKIQSAGNNYKKIWDCITEVTNHNKNCKDNIEQIILANNTQITNKEEIASAFNEFFIEIGEKISREIPKHTQNLLEYSNTNQNLNSMFLEDVTDTEIKNIIGCLKNNSSPGKDGITVKTLKLISNHIGKPIAHIINLIFKNADIPEVFKESIVVPIYKNGNKKHMTNYRPISLINNVAKIFEKCLNYRLRSFLEKNKILSKNQYGFQKNLSTEDPLQLLTDTIITNFERSEKVIAIFLDLQKAFDTVSHSQLLDKLNKVGIRGNVHNLLKQYLSNRPQQVKIDNAFSTRKTIKTGVPQGTVLGPTLFLLFINDLLDKNFGCEIISYADDTALICSGETWTLARQKAAAAISKVKTWLDINSLKLNIAKTNFMTFSPTKTGMPQTMEPMLIDEETKSYIHNTTTIKYLGVIFDNHLKWEKHIKHLNGKLRKLIYKFYNLKSVLNRKTLLVTYNSLAESIIRYGISVWGSAYNTTLQSLQITQNYILRTIFNKKSRDSCRNIFVENEILNVRGLYMHAAAVYTHNKKHIFGSSINHRYETRINTKNKYQTPKYSKTVSQKQVKYNGIKLYNQLPELIKAQTKKKFKKQCKKYLINNYTTCLQLLA